MSGGPFGRGKAPERCCRTLNDWPEHDRQLWLAAINPADPFVDTGGTRAGHRPISNEKVEKGYGRWLTFLDGQGWLCEEAAPADRITPDWVKAYIKALQALGNKKNTILSRLQELGDMAKAIAPERDWSFIARMSSKVRAQHEVPRDKRSKMVGSGRLVDLGLDLMEQAAKPSTARRRAEWYRDGLLIALLALIPLRRKNVVGLAIGKTLVKSGSDWIITIPAEASKNHDPLEFAWPDILKTQLEVYLRMHRPILAELKHRWTTPVGQALWLSLHGSPLTQMAVYDIVRKRTKAAFGQPINPHLFRDEAATTLAIHDPEHVRSSAPLLGHRELSTTERYYQQARSLQASRAYAKAITQRRQAAGGAR